MMHLSRFFGLPLLSLFVVLAALSYFVSDRGVKLDHFRPTIKELQAINSSTSPTVHVKTGVSTTVHVKTNSGQVSHNKPPLSSLVDDHEKIIGDVQWLLDFAIIGHPKTATSSLMNWLGSHEGIQTHNREIRCMGNKPGEFVKLMYELPEGKRGYKNPNDIRIEKALTSLTTYFPETPLMIGIRHPISWFQSYYNFKTRRDHVLPPPESMTGFSLPPQVFQHVHLSMLHKTNPNDSREWSLLSPLFNGTIPNIPPLTNKVFLYDVSQPFDQNQTRNELFRKDLQAFLGLSMPLDPLEVRAASRNEGIAMDICDERFRNLRDDLLVVGSAASTWIREYFLPHPDVIVSSPAHFEAILDTWIQDPCDAKQKNAQPVFEKGNMRPPLSSLVKDQYTVTGNVEKLLDFAIVAHAKTATSAFEQWLQKHDDLLSVPGELHALTVGKPGLFVSTMYDISIPSEGNHQYFYKAPNDLTSRTPRSMLRTYFPNTKLIVGIRHPVKWFESWYNFNVRKGKRLEPLKYYYNNLPGKGMFHLHLAMMGKTNVFNPRETELLAPFSTDPLVPLVQPPRMSHQVFLYEVSQPFDKNETRNKTFRDSFARYIGLSTELEPLVARATSRNSHIAIDICDDEHSTLRENLVKLGAAASTWIRDYFLPLEDVTYSSHSHIVELLSTWDSDPCIKSDGR